MRASRSWCAPRAVVHVRGLNDFRGPAHFFAPNTPVSPPGTGVDRCFSAAQRRATPEARARGAPLHCFHTVRVFAQLSARVAGAVPYRLLDEASWATQGCAPLLRSAITFSARRALAAGIRRSTCSGAEAAFLRSLSAATISPPPTRRAASTARLTRLLLSSDLLRVPGWSVLR